MKARIESARIVRGMWWAKPYGETDRWLYFHRWSDALVYALTGKIPR